MPPTPHRGPLLLDLVIAGILVALRPVAAIREFFRDDDDFRLHTPVEEVV
jgi:hypothetical protein